MKEKTLNNILNIMEKQLREIEYMLVVMEKQLKLIDKVICNESCSSISWEERIRTNR